MVKTKKNIVLARPRYNLTVSSTYIERPTPPFFEKKGPICKGRLCLGKNKNLCHRSLRDLKSRMTVLARHNSNLAEGQEYEDIWSHGLGARMPPTGNDMSGRGHFWEPLPDRRLMNTNRRLSACYSGM